MKIIEVKDYEEMSNKAGEHILNQVIQNSKSILGLATGGTPVGAYQYLIKAYQDGKVSFKDVQSFNLDEYVGLNPDHSNSYRYFMQTELFDHIDIPTEHTRVPNGMASDLEAECSNYDASIEAIGGIDLQLLGIGVNGHIAFNEPGTPFSIKTNITPLTESTREANKRFFAHIDEVPTQAITMGLDSIMRSKEILILISGTGKAEILDQLLHGDVTEEIPASILKNHANVTLIADHEALSLAKKRGL